MFALGKIARGSHLFAAIAPFMIGGVPVAHCDGAQKVGSFSSSGFIFKDTVTVTAFPDPKLEGITVYLSSVDRPITDRLRKDFFTDPSQTSVSVSQTGPIRVKDKIQLGADGEEVFSESRNLFFKTIHVRRIYDEANQTLVYVAYSSRVTQDMAEQNSRYRTSLSSVSLFGQGVDVTKATP